MPTIEHSQVDDHPSKEPTFAKSKEEAGCDQSTVRFGETKKGRDRAPCRDEHGKVVTSFELLHHPI